jgi:CheY-like chemotaxis protein
MLSAAWPFKPFRCERACDRSGKSTSSSTWGAPHRTLADETPLPAAKNTAPIVERMPLVLVVDDDPMILETVAEVLVDERYVVATARDGAEALALLRNGLRPAAILLDLWMPVLDGQTALREMKLDPALREIPVIVMTAHLDAKRKVAAESAAFLPKPLHLDILIDTVAEHVNPRFLLT